MKRFVLFLVAALGFAVMLPVLGTEIPEKDWEYERIDDDHVVIHNADQSRRIAAIDPDTAGDIVVPSTLRSMQVVSIGEKAFYNCTNLTSVTIPEGVTNIADNAFYGCSSLTNVVFPTSLKSIGANAFNSCTKLAAVNLVGASLSIEANGFVSCAGMTTFSFVGDSITLGASAFSGCNALCNLDFVAKELNVGGSVFASCTALTNAVLTVTSSATLGASAFSGCSKLCDFILSAKDLNVGDSVFANCTSLTNAVLTVTSSATLGASAFSGCSKLCDFTLAANDLNVGGSVFANCTSLTNAALIGTSSATLGASVFSGCSRLYDFTLDAKNLSVGNSVFANCTSLTNAVLIGTSSATIGVSAFSGCTALQTIELPIALNDIATNAFYACKKLDRVSLSTNVTHISYRAFDSCTSLKSVEMAEGLSSIDAQAFYGCSSITNLVFPKSLTSIGARTFERCEGLTQIAFMEGGADLVEEKSVTIGERAFYQCSSVTNVVLSQAVTSIGERAFSQCETLVSINLPTNFVDIASSLFEDCVAMSEIKLPSSLASIGNNAFFNCTNLAGFLIPTDNTVSIGSKAFKNTKYWNDYPNDLVVNNGYILGFKGNPTSVTLPETCRSIPASMFEGMTTLKSVMIPDSVTEIGARAFNGCTALTNIAFNSVTTMGNSVFEGCSSLATVGLSEKLAALPGNSFKDCTSLTTVDIPAKATSIGEYAFYNCTSLVTVTGGESVTSVGDYAFALCYKLQSFAFPKDVSYGDHVFYGCTWTENVLFPSIGTMKDEYPETYSSIKSIVFSSNMSIVTNGACAGCASLAYIQLPNGVTSIGESAFDGCTSLTSVVMSASVESVATNSFAGCSAIVSVVVSGKFAISTAFPDSYDKMSTIGLASGTTSLMDDLFAGCAELASVDIPWTVTKIGGRAFYCCSNLTEIVVPEYVTEISSTAFKNCHGLKHVDYLCEQPSVSEDIYSGTRADMMSRVLPRMSSWLTTTNSAGTAILPTSWPSGDNGRPIVWWGSVRSQIAQIHFSYADNVGGGTNVYFMANAGRQLLESKLPEEPEREGYTFVGWFTAKYGGTQIEDGVEVGDSVTYYAHWSKDDEEVPEEYDFSRANTYCGYLLDGDSMAGTVQIKFAKGRWDDDEEETNAVATASIQLLGESKVTAKGTLHEDGSGEAEHAKSERTLDFSLEGYDSLTGSFDDYSVVAYRNLFSSSLYDDRSHADAMMDDAGGKYVVVLSSGGDGDAATGYAALSVNVTGKGKAKVTGTMPDGTKVSATAQMAMEKTSEAAKDTAVIPVLAPMYSKKGGFGFLLTIGELEDGVRAVSLSGVSKWIADKEGTEVELAAVGVQAPEGLEEGDYAFGADISSLEIEGVTIEDSLSPDGTEFTATERKWTFPKADRVKFDRDEGYIVTTENGNPAALKLTYTASTGMFKGTFKVYGITDEGKSKKYTANVNGGVVGGVGYATAIIKKVGSVPAIVE